MDCGDNTKIQTKFAVNFGGPYVCKGVVADVTKIRFVQVKTPSVPISISFAAPLLGSSIDLSAIATAGFAKMSSNCVVITDLKDRNV